MTFSAGIIVHRAGNDGPEILLVHPGGPFWAGKDDHAWSIPKGEFDPQAEDGEAAAAREFTEETGHPVPDGPRHQLAPVKAGRKTIVAWLVPGDLDAEAVVSNTFEMEWPPRSGRVQHFPEVDRAAWVPLSLAQAKLHKGQAALVELIDEALAEE